MAKSSLKTFLRGENKYQVSDSQGLNCRLKNSSWLMYATTDLFPSFDMFTINNTELWNIDVLDDGTAITYCAY